MRKSYPKPGSCFTPENLAAVERLSAEGLHARQIANQLGLIPEQVGSIKGALTRRRKAIEFAQLERAAPTGPTSPRFQRPQGNSQKRERLCLTHRGPFMSDGPHNHICPSCTAGHKRITGCLDEAYSLAGVRV